MSSVIRLSLILISLMFIQSCKSLLVPDYKGKESKQYNGKKFKSPDNNKMGDFRELMVYQIRNKKKKWPILTEKDITITKVKERVNSGIGYKMINHSTILLQHEGMNILTDPVYVKRASPFQFMGPKRRRPPALPYDDLPPIDVVIISHDHYDHLDVKTLQRLSNDHQCTFLVGLGLKAFLAKFSIKNVIEMDWQDQHKINTVNFTFLPAKHWSNRGVAPFKTLWGSWMMESKSKTIYFAGDTGYDTHFETIKEDYPIIDLALIPIGAYVPRSFMKYVHMPPEDAIKAHKVLDPLHSFAIHWGTFQLTGEGMYDPINELQEIMNRESIHNFEYDRDHNGYGYIE